MSRWRITVVAVLVLVPFALLAAVGSYHLWEGGWSFYAWWPLAGSMAAGYLLGWYWQRKQQLLKPPDFEAAPHWTERDARAWLLVEARAKAGAQFSADQLSDIQHYLAPAQEMAAQLAQFYHPGAKDPVGNLTVPEILAVVELASHDLAVLVDSYLPGGHLMTINDWRLAKRASDWYQSASNLYWVVSALFSPVNTGLRYAASQVGLSTPLQMLQQNLLLWFYTAYVHRLVTYLIDLNSGRLRVGAARYRVLLDGLEARPGLAGPRAGAAAGAAAPALPAPAEPADQVRRVTVTLMGQVKAGKSSLANALLGEQRARVDV